MPYEENMILKFNQDWKSYKVRTIVYVDLESFIKKIDECKNKS